MQCIERGLVDLDEDVTKHLPEWKEAMILTGFDEKNGGKPILIKPVNVMTLRYVVYFWVQRDTKNHHRHLLSHTSGITGLENEQVMQYHGAMGDNRATLIPRYFMSNDPEVTAKALGEIREVMGSLVCPILLSG